MNDPTNPRDLTDAELIGRLLARDQRAGAELFRRHFGVVRQIFLLNVSDAEAADDLTQETMVGCFRRLDTLANRDRFRAWLIGIAYNKLKDYYRRKKRLSGREVLVDQLSAYEAEGPDAAFSALAKDRDARILAEALRRIPIEAQRLLMHFYWDSLTRAELAEIFEVPVGTIGSRLNYARKLVGRRLAEIEAGEIPVHDTTRPLEKWRSEVRRAHCLR